MPGSVHNFKGVLQLISQTTERNQLERNQLECHANRRSMQCLFYSASTVALDLR